MVREIPDIVAELATLKSYETLLAPFDGTITARFIDPGALVQNAGSNMTSSQPVLTIADKLQEWFEQRGADGFNVVPPLPPLTDGGFVTFAEKVVPELQRRGIFRTEYEGTTLRENLGLPRPENRFFPAQTTAHRAARRNVHGSR